MGESASLTSILGGASIGAQAYGQLSTSRANAQAADYNAEIAKRNSDQDKIYASQAGQIGDVEVAQSQQHTKEQIAGIRANQGASGVDIHSGSFANVVGSAAQTGMLDAMTIRANAARAAYRYQVGAVDEQAEAQLLKNQAKNEKRAGVINATTTALGGYSEGVRKGVFSDPWSKYTSSKAITGQQEQDLIDNPWQTP